MAAKKRGVGRPSKYDPKRMLPVVTAMARLAATDVEIAQALQVPLGTVEFWARQHPEFLRALKPPKKVANERVVRSLFKRAIGYSYDSEDVFLVDHDEELPGVTPDAPKIKVHTKKALRVPVVKHVPPDTTAAIFWLKNREREQWRDYKATELSTPPGRPLEFQQVGASEPELIGAYYKRMAASTVAGAGADPGAGKGLDTDRREPEKSGSSPRTR